MAFVWLSLAEAILVAVGLLAIYEFKGARVLAWQPSLGRAKLLLKSSLPLLLAGLAVTLYMRLDIVMLKQMADDQEVGIYSAATKISEILYFFPVLIVASVSPYIIKLQKSDPIQYAMRLRQLYFFLSWLAVGLSIPFSFFADQIVEVLYGRDFLGAGRVLAIHVWASLAVFLGVASSQHLLVENLQKISFYRTLIGLICNVILNLLMIPTLGAIGAAAATVVSYFVATFSLVFFKATRKQSIQLLVALFYIKHR